MAQKSHFRLRTMQEAHAIAAHIGEHLPDSHFVQLGLCELLINAIEHGNLGISYDEKKMLIESGTLEETIEHRLAAPEHRDKFATVEYVAEPHVHSVTIRDQGNGFDWLPYLAFSEDRALEPHGRGIAIAASLAYASLEYYGNGNTLVYRIAMPSAPETTAR